MDATAIILAAGEGTRMKSNHCKVSHKILGKPMVQWIVDATIKAGCSRVVVVIGSHADEMRALIDGAYANSATKVECVEQAERLGTGHAVKVALEACGITQGPVVVLNGDLPLITAGTVAKFAQTVATGELACTVMTMTPPDPFGYGRIKLGADGQIERIIEQKDCTPEQAATLLECNAGCYAFDGAQLATHINEIGNDNAQSEYYLPDMLEILKGHGQAVSIFHCDDYRDGLGVNSRIQLAQLTAIARDRINERWMAEGVTFIDPTQAWIGPDAAIGRDTVVWPQTHLIGHVTVGEECQLGPNSRLTDTTVGSGCIIDETIAIEAVIENGVDCGPRAYLRPGTLCANVKELKAMGAGDIYVCATHGIFSGPAIERLNDAPIVECLVTDAIPVEVGGKIKTISVAEEFAQAISAVYHEEPVSTLVGGDFAL